jgi:hypothetical protein
MTDDQINSLRNAVLAGVKVFWRDDEVLRKIRAVPTQLIDLYNDGTGEPLAILDNGKVVALWACEIEEFVIADIRPLFTEIGG